jgi:hypothetical protein
MLYLTNTMLEGHILMVCTDTAEQAVAHMNAALKRNDLPGEVTLDHVCPFKEDYGRVVILREGDG